MCSHSNKKSDRSKKKVSKNAALKSQMKPCTVQVNKMCPQDVAPYLKRSIPSPVEISNDKKPKPKAVEKSRKSKEKKMTEKIVISLSQGCIINTRGNPTTRKSSRLSKSSQEDEAQKRFFLANLDLVDHETAQAIISEQNCPQLQASRWAAIRSLQPLIFKKNYTLAKKLLRIRKVKMTKSMKTARPGKRGRPAKNKNKKKRNNDEITTLVIPQNLDLQVAILTPPPSETDIDFHQPVAENRRLNSSNSAVPAVTSSYPELTQPLDLSCSTKNIPQTSSIRPPFDSSRGNTEISLMHPWVTAEVSHALPLTSFEKLEIFQSFLADVIVNTSPAIECITID